MPPQLAVGGKESGSEECGELAGRGAAQQIHLEEPILGVHIAERECEVASILRRDGGHAGGVAAHADLSMHAALRARPSRRGRLARSTSHAASVAAMTAAGKDDREYGEAPTPQAPGAAAQRSAHRAYRPGPAA